MDYSASEHPKKKPVDNASKKRRTEGPENVQDSRGRPKDPKTSKTPEESYFLCGKRKKKATFFVEKDCFLCEDPHFVKSCPQKKCE